jgi:hypothetical protein
MGDEPSGTAESVDGQSDTQDIRNDIHVLFIEGQASFMPNKYYQVPRIQIIQW